MYREFRVLRPPDVEVISAKHEKIEKNKKANNIIKIAFLWD